MSKKSFAELRDETNETGVQFMITELEAGLSFLDIAAQSIDPHRREQLNGSARKAHETVLRLLPRFAFSAQVDEKIQGKLRQLRGRLDRVECKSL